MFTSSVQLLSHVQLFVIPWTVALQASLSITNSQNAAQRGWKCAYLDFAASRVEASRRE